jgi:hypothetical protein
MDGAVNLKQTNAYFTELEKLLRFCLEFLVSLDKEKYFSTTVTDDVAPGYSKLIRNPVAVSSVRSKVETHGYNSLDEMNDDVLLMVKNCLTYNSTDSPYSVVCFSTMLQLFRVDFFSSNFLGCCDTWVTMDCHAPYDYQEISAFK